ncbi:hypothetical protein AB0B85_11180 [Micromonospora sp. NPDC049044]|uniref:hypothetical protein n=1 Tax=unclassified Micromonospora TaxID=2617518 RepID=UPI003407D479
MEPSHTSINSGPLPVTTRRTPQWTQLRDLDQHLHRNSHGLPGDDWSTLRPDLSPGRGHDCNIEN